MVSGRTQVLVQGVFEGLPAARGGVHARDQIIEINDRLIEGLKEGPTALSEIHPGDAVPLVIRRGSGNRRPRP